MDNPSLDKLYKDLNKLPGANSSHQITIDQQNLLEDTRKVFDNNTIDYLRGKFSLKFLDSPGIDAGGLRKEFFYIVSEAIFDKNKGLFRSVGANDSYLHPSQFSDNIPLEDFEFVGKFVAKAILDK